MSCSTDPQEDSPDDTSYTGSISGDSVTDRPISDGASVSESDPVDHSSATKDSDDDRFDAAEAIDSFDDADQDHETDIAMVFVTESKPEKATAKDDQSRFQGPKHDEPAPDFIPLPSCSSDYGDLPEDHPVFTQSSALAPVVQEIKLGEEQARLVELIMSGYNVFYTGSAGVGKSTVLRCFVSRMREGKASRYRCSHGQSSPGGRRLHFLDLCWLDARIDEKFDGKTGIQCQIPRDSSGEATQNRCSSYR